MPSQLENKVEYFKREKQLENGGHKVCMPKEGYDHIQEDVFCIHGILNNLMMQVGVNSLIAQQLSILPTIVRVVAKSIFEIKGAKFTHIKDKHNAHTYIIIKSNL